MQKQIFAHKRDSPELAVYLCQILSDPPDSWAVQILTPLPTWERLALLAWRSSGERCRPSYRMHPKIDDVIECFEMWKLIFKATIKYSIYKVKAKSKARWRLGQGYRFLPLLPRLSLHCWELGCHPTAPGIRSWDAGIFAAVSPYPTLVEQARTPRSTRCNLNRKNIYWLTKLQILIGAPMWAVSR